MKLNELEKEIESGKYGEPRRFALKHQKKVGRFFDAEKLIEVSQVHIMADAEALGYSGIEFLENLSNYEKSEREVWVPTITDPRGADFKAYENIRQSKSFVDMEKRAIKAFKSLGVMMTDTCINYQVFMPPVLGEHLAFGDTGSSIYANSVLGARTNFEGGPSALASSLTGRTPMYGLHLEKNRIPNKAFLIKYEPKDFSDWGALGAIIGKQMNSYWDVPIIYGLNFKPTSDELKHLGAAMASFGSTPLFHIDEITPESHLFKNLKIKPKSITKLDLNVFYKHFHTNDDRLDVVVFAAPQLSLDEMRILSEMLDGRKVHPNISLIVCTAPSVKVLCDTNDISQRIEKSGGIILEGVCFYNMHAREIGEANGWKRLMSNSAKISNILGGYGYETILSTMEKCVDSACQGRIVK